MLYVVGLGPGGHEQLSYEAKEAIINSEVIVGYVTYMKLVKDLVKGKELVHNGMRQEVERCQKAIDIAVEGKDVAVISSGDAGVYGMAGLILELMHKQNIDIPVKVVPGITASIGGAALLGAPLMNDFCHISLSDLMTPWEMIEKRLHAASSADFVICLYNPRSKGRPHHLKTALDIMKQYKSEDTVVGLAKDVGRPKEEMIITTIKDLDETLVDMTTVVIVGNKETYVSNGRMLTPRGYSL
ncbi:precorrin-3B C(17)-methyltransferase [Vagococcus carniphilus]|uniref:Precorrin-3B C(17)-methyltransferase n=1 Tax=Vagococcus carniphilus TaxID=218144 RepID=A0A430B6Z9_9ENTE|nr:precorrin-3B C(17)-methyltransferase [Vagococcus carniphilus]MDT2814471.1 precorrin-3B C(17)-methyltransferase [Vagococcus carniphilus]MDT2830538.1 precorrin-3B C(17)-methyltransferase [Vagococcus carniphilus]MDT2832584.1 precorrin-3B C(17)-methyltransferase [Vagococcus carniphilus]MDT2839836.1 precorrin-3B C(17)-methyltransferase [Vagococcus carniphilus]MDT2849775.1 precorrin-3B C(17)-methyltransferase [Vagococcus carniphilus]